MPEARDFVGEPWFGQTEHAGSQLPKGGFVQRDTAAIRIIGAAQLPEDPAPEDRDLVSVRIAKCSASLITFFSRSNVWSNR